MCALSAVGLLHRELSVPVTCKIRVFEDVVKTVSYAQMLERAGCQVQSVEGVLSQLFLQKPLFSAAVDSSR